MARKDPEFSKKARERIAKWDENFKYNRDQYHEFFKFVLGGQWEDDEAKVFQQYKKIPLTVNKLAPLMNHLISEQRQNTPNLQVVPDQHVPENIINIREALVKDISLSSHAKIVYQTAFQQAAIGGYGAYLVDKDYDNNYGFDQHILFRAFKDATKCYWDVGAENPCKTDGMFAGFRTPMSRQKVRSLYGKKIEKAIPSTSSEDGTLVFADDDCIVIIDDYERKYDIETIYKLSNDKVVNQEEFNALERTTIDDIEILLDNGEPVTIDEQRNVNKYKIKHKKIAGDYILEETDFPSEQLPLIFVDQNSYWDKDGKQVCRPFLKDAKDAQRYLNYLKTQSAYLIKISRYDQFLVSKNNVKSNDTQTIWRDPMNVQGGLIYDESPTGSKPEQLRPPELSQSLILQYESTLRDIQTSTGMYDTQMGEQGNEISGAAIDARTKRGSFNTYIPFDSLNRAIACGGEVVNEMINSVYDTQRLMMLNMPDQGLTPVSINEPMDDYGSSIKNDITQGRFKVRLLPGPSFEGQKQEGLESLQMVLQANPQVFNLIADLYAENLPFPNNIELKNRLKTIVPEQVIQAGKTGQPIPQNNQPDPQTELMMKELQLKQQEIQTKQAELQIKAKQAQDESAREWQQLEANKLQIAAQLQEQELRYQSELHRTNTDMNIAHADNLIKLLTSGHKNQTDTRSIK